MTEDPIQNCANCGHLKSQHFHISRTYKHGRKLKCHALVWRRGEQKECKCRDFQPKGF